MIFSTAACSKIPGNREACLPEAVMRLRLVVLATALCMTPVECIPLHQFIGYPFQDVATFRSVDDDFMTVSFAVPFPLGTTEYGRVHVSLATREHLVHATRHLHTYSEVSCRCYSCWKAIR